MNEFLFPSTPADGLQGPPTSGTTDPHLTRQSRRHRWEVTAARWRAHELASHVFGTQARVHLGWAAATGGFRALVHLEVPFRNLDAHRARERIFVQHASGDELLRRVPLVYVFTPRTAP